jgi:hypothetical protein
VRTNFLAAALRVVRDSSTFQRSRTKQSILLKGLLMGRLLFVCAGFMVTPLSLSYDYLQEARADKWKPPPFESEDTKRANE